MKPVEIAFTAILLVHVAQAHAAGTANNGGRSIGSPSCGCAGSVASKSHGPQSFGVAAVGNSTTSGAGGRASLVDGYQPWPQSEMQQFAKPRFIPYAGE